MKLNLGCGHNYLNGWVNVDGPREELCYSDLKADIHTNIEKLEYPYFAEWNPFLSKDIHKFGEDLWFSDRCAQAGILLYVNLKCFIGHWAKQGMVIGWQHLQRKALVEGLTDPERLIS